MTLVVLKNGTEYYAEQSFDCFLNALQKRKGYFVFTDKLHSNYVIINLEEISVIEEINKEDEI